jgi:hypothetical protein
MLRRFTLALASVVVMAASLLAISSSFAKAADFKIIKIIDAIDRPDLPCCTHFYLYYTPVISGDRVAFLSRNGPPDGVWSADINTKVLTKLAGLETPAPGGTGNFTTFYGGGDLALTIGGSTVAFFAGDAAGVWGVFTVPVDGGPVKRVATLDTTSPDGTKFNYLLHASTNGSKVVFYGRTPNHSSGIYQASTSGKNLETVIDDGTLLDARSPSGTLDDYFGSFGIPVIGKRYVDFYASGVFDPVSGANAIFEAKDGFLDIADNLTHLPGGSEDHVRISAFSADVQSAAVAFRADQPVTGFAGIFKAKNMDESLAFATTKDRVPGISRKFTGFLAFGYDASGLAFVGTHATSGGSDQSIYFVPTPGEPILKVAGGSLYYFPTLGDRSISEGRIVFMDGSNFADKLYVAVPRTP